MICAVMAMLFVSLLLLSEVSMGIVVITMLALIDLNLFGFMYYWVELYQKHSPHSGC